MENINSFYKLWIVPISILQYQNNDFHMTTFSHVGLKGRSERIHNMRSGLFTNLTRYCLDRTTLSPSILSTYVPCPLLIQRHLFFQNSVIIKIRYSWGHHWRWEWRLCSLHVSPLSLPVQEASLVDEDVGVAELLQLPLPYRGSLAGPQVNRKLEWQVTSKEAYIERMTGEK